MQVTLRSLPGHRCEVRACIALKSDMYSQGALAGQSAQRGVMGVQMFVIGIGFTAPEGGGAGCAPLRQSPECEHLYVSSIMAGL